MNQLPQHTEFERAVLGAIMLDSGAMARVEPTLFPEAFHQTHNQLIYQACLSLHHEGQNPIDILKVKRKLQEMGRWEVLKPHQGAVYLTDLTAGVASSANIEYHSRVLVEAWIRRQQVNFASEINRWSQDMSVDVFDGLDKIRERLLDIEMRLSRGKVTTAYDHATEAYHRIEDRVLSHRQGLQATYGIPGSLDEINRITNGWQLANVSVIAGRPSMGKTALALQESLAAIAEGSSVLMFSLDQSGPAIMERCMAMSNNIEGYRMSGGLLSDAHLNLLKKSRDGYQRLPFELDDRAARPLSDMLAKMRAWKTRIGEQKGMVVIDYLQLMVGRNGRGFNANAELEYIMSELKGAAKSLNVHIMILSQLSRNVDTRDDPRPTMRDLRSSGAIEQDADFILFPYRPAYYMEQRGTDMVDEEGNAIPRDMAILITAKNRMSGGWTGDIIQRWDEHVGVFRPEISPNAPEINDQIHIPNPNHGPDGTVPF